MDDIEKSRIGGESSQGASNKTGTDRKESIGSRSRGGKRTKQTHSL